MGRALLSQSPLRLFVTPWTVAQQAPLTMGFSRQEYWSVLTCPPPGDLSHLGIEPRFLILQADFLYHLSNSFFFLPIPPCLPQSGRHHAPSTLPGSSVHGILQARTLKWVAIPFSRGSSWARDQTWVSCITCRFFTTWTTREAQYSVKQSN